MEVVLAQKVGNLSENKHSKNAYFEWVTTSHTVVEVRKDAPWQVLSVVQGEANTDPEQEPIHKTLPNKLIQRYHPPRQPLHHHRLIKQLKKVYGEHGERHCLDLARLPEEYVLLTLLQVLLVVQHMVTEEVVRRVVEPAEREEDQRWH